MQREFYELFEDKNIVIRLFVEFKVLKHSSGYVSYQETQINNEG